MKNPTDFVMYVVMLKKPNETVFAPYWHYGSYAQGFAHKTDANKGAESLNKTFGPKSAYVQQYGPYK